MLPSILAKQLEKGIGDYIKTTFPITNQPFKGSIQKLLETKDSVYHEPYVAVRLPFRVAEEMNPVTATFWVIMNVFGNAFKKWKYVKRYEVKP